MESGPIECPRNGIMGTLELEHLHEEEEESIDDLTGKLHLLPCCIKHNGPCQVSHYFKPKQTDIVVDDLRVEEASFRGRKLHGATIPIPQGYCGFVLEKQNASKRHAPGSPEASSNHWKAHAKFQNITYWNHDSLPSRDDALLRCFHWFPVANAIHKTVTADELASSIE